MSIYTSPSRLQSGLDGVQVSRLHIWNTVRLERSNIKFGRVKCLPSCKLNSLDNVKEYHTYQRQKTKLLASAATDFSNHQHDEEYIPSQTMAKRLRSMLDIWYRYSKVFTVKGTALSVISISLLAIEKFSDFTPLFFLGVSQGIAGACLATLFVAAINQLYDIEIDKVNKPFYPLASGELSVKAGVLITSTYVILGFLLAWSVNSWPLKLGIFLWFALGTVYSVDVPLMRWKKVPVLAAFVIWSLLGAIIPIFFHLHAMINITGRQLLLSKHAIFVSVLMSIYAINIALLKDLPDVEGDKMNGIATLALQIGQKQVFWICVWLFEIAYGAATLIGLSSSRLWVRFIMVLGHSFLGFILWKKATLVDVENSEATESFYQFIWKLYYAEYLLVPFLRF